ncbi:MAG: lipid II flippase MurJ, partial [Candidatus Dormibacteraceae bacterium]
MTQVVTTAPVVALEAQKAAGSGLLRNTAIFASVSFCAYLVSLAKTIMVTRYFGTSPEMDAFTVSVLVPNLLGALVMGSASAGLVPSLGRAEQSGARSTVYRSALAIFVVLSLVASLLLALFAGPIIRVIAPAFDPYLTKLATELAHWSSLLVLVNTVTGFASAELLSRRKYGWVAAAPAAATSISLGCIVAYHRMGVSILLSSLLVGLLAQMLIVLIPSWRATRGGLSKQWRNPDVAHVIRGQVQLFAVGTIGITNVFVDQVISALLPTGTVSALSYASNLNMVVVQIVVMAMSAVVLTDLSAIAGSRDWIGLKHRVKVCAITSLMLAAPVCLMIIGVGHPAIQLLFQHGVFRADSADSVYIAWSGYSLG